MNGNFKHIQNLKDVNPKLIDVLFVTLFSIKRLERSNIKKHFAASVSSCN